MKNKCKIHGADFCSACYEVSRLKKEGKHAKAKKIEKKLAILKTEGILTDDEFNQQKRKLLSE